VISTLRRASVQSVLARLRSEGEQHDAEAKRRLAYARRNGSRAGVEERAEMCAQAPIAVSDEVGLLLYTLARARGPRLAVEFGGSLGTSTLYVAAALADNGRGRLITSEIHPGKAQAATVNLTEAGLADLVEMRVGDALHTLDRLDQPIDMLLLDGWNELYLPLLTQLEPQLTPDALLVADLSANDPDLLPYLAHVRDPASAWTSITIPLDAGVELSNFRRLD
jgi:predicted O-methyltransferase YrrM